MENRKFSHVTGTEAEDMTGKYRAHSISSFSSISSIDAKISSIL